MNVVYLSVCLSFPIETNDKHDDETIVFSRTILLLYKAANSRPLSVKHYQ
jgi:hypothetical protein